MPSNKQMGRQKLPGRFQDLVRMMPPQAIIDDIHYQNTVAMIDRVMASGKLTKGQALYLETLVQLVQAYEASHHAIDTADISELDSLQHLLDKNALSVRPGTPAGSSSKHGIQDYEGRAISHRRSQKEAFCKVQGEPGDLYFLLKYRKSRLRVILGIVTLEQNLKKLESKSLARSDNLHCGDSYRLGKRLDASLPEQRRRGFRREPTAAR